MQIIKNLLLLFLNLISFTIIAQVNDNSWKEMLQDGASFYSTKNNFEAYVRQEYVDSIPNSKLSNIKDYYRFVDFWKPRIGTTNNLTNYSDYFANLNNSIGYCTSTDMANWELLGPTQYKSQYMGLVQQVLYEPRYPNSNILSSEHGGIWKQRSNGNSWNNVTDNLQLPGISATEIIRNPFNSDHLIASTASGIHFMVHNYIRAFGLKNGDINALLFYAKTINQYKEYEVFSDFANAIEKVLYAVTIRKGISNKEQALMVVQTESTPKLRGSELIPDIVSALDTNRIIEFQYQKFGDQEFKTTRLQPYLLKEDRHRWYIIGRHVDHIEKITTYALDRIKSLTIPDEKFVRTDFDFEQYFKYSFGITVPAEVPVEVVLSFTPYQGNYIKTLKLHPTQQELVDDDKEYRISIHVKPSWEFYEKILGYGKSVKILSPQAIIDEFKTKINEMAEQYK